MFVQLCLDACEVVKNVEKKASFSPRLVLFVYCISECLNCKNVSGDSDGATVCVV